MKSVKIETQKLLEVLKKNLETHKKDYEEALIGYRESSIKEMKAMLKQAQNGGEIVHHVSTVMPISYAESYDTIIGMLEMTVDPSVELSMNEFQQYVEDKWTWKQSFLASTSMYNGKL